MKKASIWQRSEHATPAFGYTESAYWFYFRLENPSADTQDLILEVAYALLDNIDVYAVSRNGAVQSFRGGDHQPFAQRQIQHRTFLFPIELKARDDLDVYLRVSSSSHEIGCAGTKR